jgi:hypothetical protein
MLDVDCLMGDAFWGLSTLLGLLGLPHATTTLPSAFFIIFLIFTNYFDH